MAARVSANRFSGKKLGEGNYFLKLRVLPHTLRENPITIGADADRVSDGMRKSLGRPTGIAARISNKQKIFIADVDEGNYETGREALRRARMKLPLPGKVSIEKGKELLSS